MEDVCCLCEQEVIGWKQSVNHLCPKDQCGENTRFHHQTITFLFYTRKDPWKATIWFACRFSSQTVMKMKSSFCSRFANRCWMHSVRQKEKWSQRNKQSLLPFCEGSRLRICRDLRTAFFMRPLIGWAPALIAQHWLPSLSCTQGNRAESLAAPYLRKLWYWFCYRR